MSFRKPEIPMGESSMLGEYERKIADPEIVRTARGILGPDD
jgi:hypothetical protein